MCDPIHYWAGVVVRVSHYPHPLYGETIMLCRKRQTWYLLVWLADAQEWHIVANHNTRSLRCALSWARNTHPRMTQHEQWAVVPGCELEEALSRRNPHPSLRAALS